MRTLLALLLLAGSAHAADLAPARLSDGRYVLLASWPADTGAKMERLCFIEPSSTAPIGCTADHISRVNPDKTIDPPVGYVLMAITGSGERRFRAYAETADGRRTDLSDDTYLIAALPAAPKLVPIPDGLIQQIPPTTPKAARKLRRKR